MKKNEIREPQQARSIEKKKNIAYAGIRLFCEKGYHHTNTNEIAKEAGVSTGIVYHYFQNKKSILMAGIEEIVPKLDNDILKQLINSKNVADLSILISDLIDKYVNFHIAYKALHEEFQALRHTDSDVAEFMNQHENKFLTDISNLLPTVNFLPSHSAEKIDIIYHMIDQYCDSIVLNKRNSIDYDIMKQLIIDIVLFLTSEIKK